MDLELTAEQRAFRDDVRAWLGENVPRDMASAGTPEGFAAHREWERTLYRAGYGGLRWPVEYGGRAADPVMQSIFEEEYLLADAPVERVCQIGINLMGPTLMTHGTEEQKLRWLPRILNADDVWSQGFSEPDAGSDLAGIKTRGVRDGDEWIVNGQKIWTSYGSNADWIFALVRTDPEASRHAGISFIAIDMRSEGVETRPIVQLDGEAGFAEVFFTDVRVPADQVIGPVNDGWAVAMTTLGFERDAPSKPSARYRRDVNRLVAIARARGVAGDGRVRDQIAALYCEAEAYRLHSLRTLTRLARGESIGPEASVTKVLWSEMERRMYETGLDVLGPYGEIESDGGPLDDAVRWHRLYWFARAATIYAGTSEIQRNIVAQRVLGLPRA